MMDTGGTRMGYIQTLEAEILSYERCCCRCQSQRLSVGKNARRIRRDGSKRVCETEDKIRDARDGESIAFQYSRIGEGRVGIEAARYWGFGKQIRSG